MTPHRYQLVEVPTALFDSIQDLPVEAFESDAPVLPCMRDGEVAASIAVDRLRRQDHRAECPRGILHSPCGMVLLNRGGT